MIEIEPTESWLLTSFRLIQQLLVEFGENRPAAIYGATWMTEADCHVLPQLQYRRRINDQKQDFRPLGVQHFGIEPHVLDIRAANRMTEVTGDAEIDDFLLKRFRHELFSSNYPV